eukprot:1342343-Amphidinium_carterae.1
MTWAVPRRFSSMQTCGQHSPRPYAGCSSKSRHSKEAEEDTSDACVVAQIIEMSTTGFSAKF